MSAVLVQSEQNGGLLLPSVAVPVQTVASQMKAPQWLASLSQSKPVWSTVIAR
jgi:hypothetical protein